MPQPRRLCILGAGIVLALAPAAVHAATLKGPHGLTSPGARRWMCLALATRSNGHGAFQPIIVTAGSRAVALVAARDACQAKDTRGCRVMRCNPCAPGGHTCHI